MVQIAVLFIMVKLNPYEVAGAPLTLGTLLINLSFGLAAEACTDFLTAVFGGARTHNQNAARSWWWAGMLCFSLCLASTESMLQMVNLSCPTPDAYGALRAVSLCPRG